MHYQVVSHVYDLEARINWVKVIDNRSNIGQWADLA